MTEIAGWVSPKYAENARILRSWVVNPLFISQKMVLQIPITRTQNYEWKWILERSSLLIIKTTPNIA